MLPVYLLRSCVKSEVAVLGSLFLIILMVSVDVQQCWTRTFAVLQVLLKNLVFSVPVKIAKFWYKSSLLYIIFPEHQVQHKMTNY